jgi:DNA polymerase III epsilon subunit-like protein
MQVSRESNFLRRKLSLLVSIPKGALIDIETTGIDPVNDEILTLGFVAKNNLVIIQRRTKSKDRFYQEISELLTTLSAPFYAYNLGFEQEFLENQLGVKCAGTDLFKPWQDRAEKKYGIKWPKLDDLISEPEFYYDEKRIRGEDVPVLWKKFLKSKKEKFLALIMRHNQSDLLRELYLLIQYSHYYSRTK